ncbi:MAG TPA: formylglycine-generating enzyme family protein [Polyangiaceae bacterium]|nr:formylglycine-generating enzyme family protein [Polyangiaceae bacterium]
MRRGTRLALGERLVLSVVLASVATLAAPPETHAGSAASAVLLPWPSGPSASETALSGGLAVLRARGSLMIRVPASEFVMGSTSEEIIDSTVLCQREPLGASCDERSFADEMLAHRVRLSAFFLDRREVTVAEFEACVRVGRCKPPPFDRGARRFKQPNYPVSLVTWDDAQAFCAFRGARLATEAEFERAARGPSGRRFPWGQSPNTRLANHGRLGIDLTDDRDGFSELSPVGSFEAGRTPDGFLDLAGNVAEWVQDRYATQYPDSEQDDPQGPDATQATSARVVRGGSYESPMAWLRGAARGAYLPSERRPSLGFRCARSQQRASASERQTQTHELR